MTEKMEIVLRKIPYFANLTKQEIHVLASRGEIAI